MRKTTLSALGLVGVLAVPAAAAGTPGPFAGAVLQGGTQTHQYNNNPTGAICPRAPFANIYYTATLRYEPASDVLDLTFGTASASGHDGVAYATVVGDYCAAFPITVHGTSVTAVAAYTVSVTASRLS
jgi:hypothetical protein